MERVADVLRPMMLRPPPALGSRHPGDVLELLREAGRAAGLRAPRPAGALPRDDDVGRRPARRLVRERRAQGRVRVAPASSACGPARARPAPPTTCCTTSSASSTASAARGATCAAGWARSPRRSPASARALGATIRTDAAVASIDVAGGRVTGVTLDRRRADHARRIVLSGAHPKTTVLDLVGARALPRRGRRGHAPLPHPRRLREGQLDPVRAAALRAGRARCSHTSLAICPSIDYLERAWQDATLGKPAERPYIEVEVPTAIDPSLTDDGTTVMTMFTQYGPHDEAGWPDGAREAYAQRCLDILAEHAPNVRDAVIALRGARAARPRAHLRPRRRLDLPGRAGPGPDGVHAPDAAALALRDARSTASTCAAPGRTRAAA